MSNEEIYCPRCKKHTPHLRINNGLAICSTYGCGHEHRTSKKENTMGGKRLNEVEIADIRGKWAALPETERTGAKQTELAADFGVSQTTIAKVLKGDGNKPAAKKTRKGAGGRKKRKAQRAAEERRVSLPKPFTPEFQVEEILTVTLKVQGSRKELPSIIQAAVAKYLK